jgi:hypothetical protein
LSFFGPPLPLSDVRMNRFVAVGRVGDFEIAILPPPVERRAALAGAIDPIPPL